jgi:hypothetical protein
METRCGAVERGADGSRVATVGTKVWSRVTSARSQLTADPLSHLISSRFMSGLLTASEGCRSPRVEARSSLD